MRRVLAFVFALVLVATLASSSVWAKSYNFQLVQEAIVNGTQLGPGNYRLKVDGDEAEIYRGGKLLVKSKVEVHPLDPGMSPQSNVIEEGELREIRLKKDCILFVD